MYIVYFLTGVAFWSLCSPTKTSLRLMGGGTRCVLAGAPGHTGETKSALVLGVAGCDIFSKFFENTRQLFLKIQKFFL